MARTFFLFFYLLLNLLDPSLGNPLCANPGRSLEKRGMYNPVFTLSVDLMGECRVRDFTVHEMIGRGNFGIVRRAVHRKTGTVVAIKYLDALNPKHYIKHRTEECNQHAVENNLIVKHYCTMVEDEKVHFVMEYLDGITFREYFQLGGKLSEEHMQYYFGQLMLLVEILHQHRIIFGSLTSANIMLLKDGKMKLIDLGASYRLKQDEAQDPVPEFVSYKARPNKWKNFAQDYYSLGLLLYELSYANGNHKWVDPKSVKKLKCGKVLDNTVCDLIYRLYTDEYDMIWGLTKTSRAYIRAHPWFEGLDWQWLQSYVNGELSVVTASSKINYLGFGESVDDDEDEDSMYDPEYNNYYEDVEFSF